MRTTITHQDGLVGRYNHMRRLLSLLLFTLILASCTNGRHARKCNGKRGERVPMGII